MPEENAIVSEYPVQFLKNGELIQEREGKPAKVGFYDRKTGHLEFETKEDHAKLIRQCSAAIGTVNKGRQSSGLAINSISVKGDPVDQPQGKIPPRPKAGPLGNKDPKVVKWWFQYYPQRAYRMYRVFLDAEGQPRTARCRRRVKELLDDRNDEYGFANEQREVGSSAGKNRHFEKGVVAEVITQDDVIEDGIVAEVPTCMTYTPNEVIGGFEAEDNGEGAQ